MGNQNPNTEMRVHSSICYYPIQSFKLTKMCFILGVGHSPKGCSNALYTQSPKFESRTACLGGTRDRNVQNGPPCSNIGERAHNSLIHCGTRSGSYCLHRHTQSWKAQPWPVVHLIRPMMGIPQLRLPSPVVSFRLAAHLDLPVKAWTGHELELTDLKACSWGNELL